MGLFEQKPSLVPAPGVIGLQGALDSGFERGLMVRAGLRRSELRHGQRVDE